MTEQWSEEYQLALRRISYEPEHGPCRDAHTIKALIERIAELERQIGLLNPAVIDEGTPAGRAVNMLYYHQKDGGCGHDWHCGKICYNCVQDLLERQIAAAEEKGRREGLAIGQPVVEAARSIYHWHDWGRDNEGMVTSSEAIRDLWAAVADYDRSLLSTPKAGGEL